MNFGNNKGGCSASSSKGYLLIVSTPFSPSIFALSSQVGKFLGNTEDSLLHHGKMKCTFTAEKLVRHHNDSEQG
eukprot:5908012-Amphidinium_carterae.1